MSSNGYPESKSNAIVWSKNMEYREKFRSCRKSAVVYAFFCDNGKLDEDEVRRGERLQGRVTSLREKRYDLDRLLST